MQSVKRELITTNDKGRLCVETVQLFRDWLALHGCTIRETGAGQFFQVKTVHGWAPVQKGRKGVVVTPVILRSAIKLFALNQQDPRVKPFFGGTDCPLVVDQHADDPTELSSKLLLLPKSLQWPPSLANHVRQKGAVLDSQKPAPSQYLSDLHDDFALHAPLVQAEGESLRDYALRRWEYAK